jgi:hypothetical protein
MSADEKANYFAELGFGDLGKSLERKKKRE